MYKNQKRLYKETLDLNRNLAAEVNDLLKQKDNLQQSIRQLQQADATQEIQQPTFINQKQYYRKHWKEYIHLSANDYKTGFLGGIKDLKININNQTDFRINRAVVKIYYYRANGDLFKTENVSLKNIAAQTSRSVSAPESPRGLSVKVDFIKITSRSMNFCYNKNKKPTSNNSDPYKCS